MLNFLVLSKTFSFIKKSYFTHKKHKLFGMKIWWQSTQTIHYLSYCTPIVQSKISLMIQCHIQVHFFHKLVDIIPITTPRKSSWTKKAKPAASPTGQSNSISRNDQGNLCRNLFMPRHKMVKAYSVTFVRMCVLPSFSPSVRLCIRYCVRLSES